MEFLNRAKASVLKATSQAAASLREIVASPSSTSPQRYDTELPRDVLLSLVHSVCGVIDQHAHSDEADSLEGDRVLYESNAREYLRKLIDMLVVDSNRWASACSSSSSSSSSSAVDSSLSLSPTPIDVFLQSNAMHEFCRRAGRDLPRGTLPMVLAFVSSLLKQARYPFLPHMAVYKPLTKLIALACRYDAMRTSSVPVDYIRRVDAALSSLLHTLWRKIAENPAVLEFFVVGTVGRHDSHDQQQQQQMDILSALQSQVLKAGRVGETAREALLVALSVRDARVDEFLVCRTRILSSVVEELGRLLGTVVDSDAFFLRLLRFCGLVFVVAQAPSSSSQLVASALADLYRRNFLQDCLAPLLLAADQTSSSSSAASLSNLLRLVLTELHQFVGESPLFTLTVEFLLAQPDFVAGLALRCSSMFPAVSVSASQLAASLLQLSFVCDAHALLVAGCCIEEEQEDRGGDANSGGTGLLLLSDDIDIRIDNARGARAFPQPVIDYLDAAAHELLERVARERARGAGQRRPKQIKDNHQEDKELPVCCFQPTSSALVAPVTRRLSGFLGLKLEEQVAVASLVTQIVSQACTAVVMSGHGPAGLSCAATCPSAASVYLSLALELIGTVTSLEADMRKHLGDLVGAEEKAAAVQTVLLANATKGLATYRAAETTSVKLLEREPPRVLRMLETAVLLRELQAQLASYIHSTARLRSMLSRGGEGAFLLQGAPSPMRSVGASLSSRCSDDEGEDGDDDEFFRVRGGFVDVEEIERQFLEQVAEFSSQLDAVVSSSSSS